MVEGMVDAVYRLEHFLRTIRMRAEDGRDLLAFSGLPLGLGTAPC